MQWKQVISSYWKIIARSSWYILPVLIWRKVCKFWFTIHYFTYLRFQLQDWRKYTAQIKEIHLRFCNKWSQLYYKADMNFFITNFIVKLFFFLFSFCCKNFHISHQLNVFVVKEMLRVLRPELGVERELLSLRYKIMKSRCCCWLFCIFYIWSN